MVGDDVNDKRMGIGRDGDCKEEKEADDTDEADEAATQEASDSVLDAYGDDSDTDVRGSAADSQSGEYVSRSETA